MVRVSRRAFLIASALALSGIAYSYYETRRVHVTKLGLGLGEKIAFLVDTHTHGFGEVEKEVLEILAREKPRIVLHGGDIIDELTSSLDPIREYLSRIDAHEKYAVLGNHDYWSGRADEVELLMEELGFKVLRDEEVFSEACSIFGVDWRDDREYDVDVDAEIVLAHDPNVVKGLKGGKLILAGHTHGGIVIGGLTVFTNSIYTRGLYMLDDGRMLYVSRGLGQMIPFRPTSPLELIIIE